MCLNLIYKQISETAIGTKLAPPYTCIFMVYIETEFLKYLQIKPCLWKRFINDILSDTEENLDQFLEDLNQFYLNLRFTYEKSRETINFLNVVIKINKGKITTNLFCKPADLDSNVENLKERFKKKSYPEQLIKDQMARTFQSGSNNTINNNYQEKKLVFHQLPPITQDLKILIVNKYLSNLQYFYADKEVKKVFTPAPFASLRGARN